MTDQVYGLSSVGESYGHIETDSSILKPQASVETNEIAGSLMEIADQVCAIRNPP
jgi:hypothetical protein